MVKNNKTCVNCGKQYSYCSSCAEDKSKPVWMKTWCSENCKNLFIAATEFFDGTLSREAAKQIVDSSNVDAKASMNAGVQKMIAAVSGGLNADANSSSIGNAVKSEKKEGKLFSGQK